VQNANNNIESSSKHDVFITFGISKLVGLSAYEINFLTWKMGAFA